MPFSRQTTAGPFAFDHAWSACLYNDAAQKLLHAFKYNAKTSLSKTICGLMIDFLDRHFIPIQQFDLMIPIPLHPARLRERGYNQSALISEPLSRHYGLMHLENALLRQKPTSTQTELGAKQRWTNTDGAFKIKNSSDVKDKIVLLVDDLYTTGATLHHAAQALKDAGAARVGALTFSVAEKGTLPA